LPQFLVQYQILAVRHCEFFESILLLCLLLPRFDSISIEWFLLNPLTTLRLNVLTYKIYFSVSKITLQLPMSISSLLLVCLSVRHQNPQAYQNQSFIHPSSFTLWLLSLSVCLQCNASFRPNFDQTYCFWASVQFCI